MRCIRRGGADPATGAAGAGASTAIGLSSVDAACLALGIHDATVCLAANDAAAPVRAVPPQVEVTASGDGLFADGFEAD